MAIGRAPKPKPESERKFKVRQFVTNERELWQVMGIHADGTLVLEDARTGDWTTASLDEASGCWKIASIPSSVEMLRLIEPEA